MFKVEGEERRAQTWRNQLAPPTFSTAKGKCCIAFRGRGATSPCKTGCRSGIESAGVRVCEGRIVEYQRRDLGVLGKFRVEWCRLLCCV